MVIDILALVMMGLAGIGAVTVVKLIILTFQYIVEWFQENAAEVPFVAEEYAVTVQKAISDGTVGVVQGVFNSSAGKFVKAREIKANRMDDRVRAAHSRHAVAIWE